MLEGTPEPAGCQLLELAGALLLLSLPELAVLSDEVLFPELPELEPSDEPEPPEEPSDDPDEADVPLVDEAPLLPLLAARESVR